MANKIKYGLKNVHYAVATIGSDGTATYGSPVAFPGAVSLSLEPQGENTPFYADNIIYWTGSGNSGYSGDLEIARIIDAFKTDILGYIVDAKGALVEDVNAEAVRFALMFEFNGDENATRHVMYNCVASRSNTSGETKGETIEPQTETTTITASSVYNSSLGTDVVKAELTKGVDDTSYNAWFTTVYQPTAAAVATTS